MKCSLDTCQSDKMVKYIGCSSPSVLFVSEETSPNQLAIKNIGSNDFVYIVKELVDDIKIINYACTAILLCPGYQFTKNNILCCYLHLNNLIDKLKPKLIVFFGNEGKKLLKYHPGNSIHLQNPSYIMTSSGSVYLSNVNKLRGAYGKLEKEKTKNIKGFKEFKLF